MTTNLTPKLKLLSLIHYLHKNPDRLDQKDPPMSFEPEPAPIMNSEPEPVPIESPQPGVDPTVVVFDLVSGVSSSHSNRTFDDSTAYTIYVRVDSDSAALLTDANSGPGTWGTWQGGENLGPDDRIVLVGDDQTTDVQGPAGTVTQALITAAQGTRLVWAANETATQKTAAGIDIEGFLTRAPSNSGAQAETAHLWSGTLQTNPNQGLTFSSMYQRTMADAILVTQGLL